MRTELVVVEVEVDERKLSWKKFRKEIEKAVELVVGAEFVGISTWSIPDPFDLKDPDDPPWRDC